MTPRAVLLDALGTLLALEPPAPALRALLRSHLGLEVELAAAERAMAAEIAFYRAHHLEGRDAASLAALRARCALVLAGELGAPAQALSESRVQEALLGALRFTPFPDAAPALDRLRSSSVRIVVVSNWDCSLHGVLDAAGLGGRVDGVVTSAEAGAAKPDRAIFERALEIAGAGASEAVHVGDSLREDVGGARAAGIEPILVARHRSGPAPRDVRVIASLHELADGAA